MTARMTVCMRQAGGGLGMHLGGCAGVERRLHERESLETSSGAFLGVWLAGSRCHRWQPQHSACPRSLGVRFKSSHGESTG